MKVLGFDLETGAAFDVPKEENWITEIGCVLWDTDTNLPLEMYNTLVQPEGKEISAEAVQYTGITTEMCEKHGEKECLALDHFRHMATKADYIVAHNGREFDIPILAARFKAWDLPTPGKPLIDTMTDLPLPDNCKSRNLTYLNGFHLFANPFPHRAITDVLSMLTVMSKYPWEEVRAIADSPVVQYIAQFSYPKERKGGNFKEAMAEFNKIKDAVKGLGFRWHPDTKTWVLKTKEIIAKDMEFPCEVTKVQ